MDHLKQKITKLKLLFLVATLTALQNAFCMDSCDVFNPQKIVQQSLEEFRKLNAAYSAGGEEFLDRFTEDDMFNLASELNTWKETREKTPTTKEIGTQSDQLVYQKFEEIARSTKEAKAKIEEDNDASRFGF